MTSDHLVALLQELGLSDNEAAVYLAGLELGPATVLGLSRAAGIRRTTVYTVIDSLVHKGLFHVEPKGLKQVYVAEHPDALAKLLDNQRTSLARAMPAFTALYNLKGADSTIKQYQGMGAVKTLYDSILTPMKPSDDYLVISDVDALIAADPAFFENYIQKRIASKVQARGILKDSERSRHLRTFGKQMNHELKLISSSEPFAVDIIITPYQVVLLTLVAPINALNIENPVTIQAFRQMFEVMWRGIS